MSGGRGFSVPDLLVIRHNEVVLNSTSDRRNASMSRQVLTLAALVVASLSIVSWSVGRSDQIEHGNVAFDVSADGEVLVFSSAEGDLFLFERATKSVRRLTDTAANETTPAFSPNGEFVVYAATPKDGNGTFIFLRTLDGKRVQQLTSDSGVSDSLPRYSRDGTQIVFARAHRHRRYSMGGWTWDDWDVYVMDSDGENLRRVTRRKHYGINKVLFSPEGATVFYSAEVDRDASDSTITVFEVSAVDPASPTPVTSKPRSARTHYAWASDPAISPDGRQLAFISDRDTPYHYDVRLLDRQTGKSRSLMATKISQYNQAPVITGGGKQLLFLASTEWNAGSRPIFSLWSMNIDGENAKQVADSGLFTDPIDWTPKEGN